MKFPCDECGLSEDNAIHDRTRETEFPHDFVNSELTEAIYESYNNPTDSFEAWLQMQEDI